MMMMMMTMMMGVKISFSLRGYYWKGVPIETLSQGLYTSVPPLFCSQVSENTGGRNIKNKLDDFFDVISQYVK